MMGERYMSDTIDVEALEYTYALVQYTGNYVFLIYGQVGRVGCLGAQAHLHPVRKKSK